MNLPLTFHYSNEKLTQGYMGNLYPVCSDIYAHNNILKISSILLKMYS